MLGRALASGSDEDVSMEFPAHTSSGYEIAKFFLCNNTLKIAKQFLSFGESDVMWGKLCWHEVR